MNACSKYGVFVLSLEHEAKFSDMDKVQKQRGSIVLHKETRNGADYIRVEYANSQAVARLLAQDTGMEMAGNGSAYIASAAFSLPDFYDRYSPHAYIDYSRVYVRHPKPKKGIHTAERLPRTAGTKALQPLDRQNIPCLFQRFHGISQGTEHRPPESAGHQQVHTLSCEREENLGVATEYAHQCYQVLLRAGERRQTAILRRYHPCQRVQELARSVEQE